MRKSKIAGCLLGILSFIAADIAGSVSGSVILNGTVTSQCGIGETIPGMLTVNSSGAAMNATTPGSVTFTTNAK